MDELEKFYSLLDESDFDCTSDTQLNSLLQNVSKALAVEGNNELIKYSDLERQSFAIRKSFDIKHNTKEGTLDGLSWQMSGTQKLEDGSEKPFYWPDVQSYSDDEFKYFEKRYAETKNRYAKVEFGLLVYFGSKSLFSKNNNFKKELFSEIFELSKKYLERAILPDDKKHYVIYFLSVIKTAYKIAESSKLVSELKEVTEFIINTHSSWDIKHIGTLRIILDFSSLMSDHYKNFKKSVDFNNVINKNSEAAKELEKKYTWGAIYVINKNIEIQNKLMQPFDNSIRYKAELYEKLTSEAEEIGNMACITFSEDALRLYQQLNDEKKIFELEKRYSELRGKFELNKIRQKLPETYTKRMQEIIAKTVEESDEKEILLHFIITPWYDKIENIKKRAEESKKQNVLLSMIGASIVDKFGNTIDVFHTQEEIEEHNFWQTYGINFQIGTQTMHQFFIQAYKAKKISFDTVMSHLEKSWFNDPIQRSYHGDVVEIKPIDLIRPGIKRFFGELELFSADPNYQLDYVTATDSLVLKIESLLRFFCEKIGIATFKPRQKGSDKLIMEKLIDDLLSDLKNSENNQTGFDEHDRMFIKYVFTEKGGMNLRNQVAHGLLDFYEYGFSNQIVVLSAILKLSKYLFSPIQK
jgi:hypothetical protein